MAVVKPVLILARELRNSHRVVAAQKPAHVQAKLWISPVDLTPKSTGAP